MDKSHVWVFLTHNVVAWWDLCAWSCPCTKDLKQIKTFLHVDFTSLSNKCSVLFRNLKKRWGYISGVHFQKCSNFSIFFTLNISTQFFPPPNGGRRKPPKYTPELVSFNGIIWSCVGKLCIVLVAYMRHFGICRFRSAVHCTQLIKIIKNDVTNQKAVLPFYSALRDLSNDIKKFKAGSMF